MADKMTRSGSVAAWNKADNMSTSTDCVCVMLEMLADLEKQLCLGEAVFRVEVDPEAASRLAPPAAHLHGCLQQHIAQLQVVSKTLKMLMDAQSPASSTKEEAVCSSLTNQDSVLSELAPPSGDTLESKTSAVDVMVQIRAGKSEIERRISAFMERKQMEINENNVREFCNVIDCNQENSCARTDAIFTPYPGFKSHVKVSRVVNTYGPQTHGSSLREAGLQHRGSAAGDAGQSAVEERLHNMETHLKLPSDSTTKAPQVSAHPSSAPIAGPVPLSVYQRLKRLEDRILELEGLSPEYFQSTSHLHKRPKMTPAQACSLTELDEKISVAKAGLLKKVKDFGPGYGFPM